MENTLNLRLFAFILNEEMAIFIIANVNSLLHCFLNCRSAWDKSVLQLSPVDRMNGSFAYLNALALFCTWVYITWSRWLLLMPISDEWWPRKFQHHRHDIWKQFFQSYILSLCAYEAMWTEECEFIFRATDFSLDFYFASILLAQVWIKCKNYEFPWNAKKELNVLSETHTLNR